MLLNCHSYYSFKYGLLSPGQLAQMAVANGYSAIALTDINNTSGILDFIEACQQHNITPITGVEFRANNKLAYIMIAQNNTGQYAINQLLSKINQAQAPPPYPAPQLPNTFVIYPPQQYPAKLPPNAFVGIKPNTIAGMPASTSLRNIPIHKCVIWHPVTFGLATDYTAHLHLRAIQLNTLLSKTPAYVCADQSELPMHKGALLQYYRNHPAIIRNTKKIITQCCTQIFAKSPKNKATFTGNTYEDNLLLEKLVLDGAKMRYGNQNPTAHQRIQQELDIIKKMGFAAYFLIAWDVVRYAEKNNFYYVGRGSGANSVVAYSLFITDVDPIELNLYFERFLNPYRSVPPDFDIDFSWHDRDHVTDYLFKRYGYKHTALLGAYVTFQRKAAIRETAKTYGLPKTETDRLINQPNHPLNKNAYAQKILETSQTIANLPMHLSIHAGGVIITEHPIETYTALTYPPKGFPVTSFDMHTAETFGFDKLDILSQRGLGHIKECAQIIKEQTGEHINIKEVEKFKKDPKVKKLLAAGETIGCFYIESPGMRGLLRKLKCTNYTTLVAASSIIRPGVAKSGMMRAYIERFNNPALTPKINPVLDQLLTETYGVMVYQEDVIKVAHHFAGLDPAEADVLRRAMSGKSRGIKHFEQIKQKYFNNCHSKGYPDTLAKEVWRQIESFSGYSFSKAHSASYAVESYQSMYLKAKHPIAFLVAVVNNHGGFYNAEFYLKEAQRLGATLHPPCILKSQLKTTLHNNTHIYLGWQHVKELSKTAISNISNATNLAILSNKQLSAFSKADLAILAGCGALRSIFAKKAEAYWHTYANCCNGTATHQNQISIGLEQNNAITTLPTLPNDNPIETAYDELEHFGFTLQSVFGLIKKLPNNTINAQDLPNHLSKIVKVAGQLITTKPIKLSNGKIMCFGGFTDAEGIFFDTVHFPDKLARYPIAHRGCYLIVGKVSVDFGHPTIEVIKAERLELIPDPRLH